MGPYKSRKFLAIIAIGCSFSGRQTYWLHDMATMTLLAATLALLCAFSAASPRFFKPEESCYNPDYDKGEKTEVITFSSDKRKSGYQNLIAFLHMIWVIGMDSISSFHFLSCFGDSIICVR